MNRSRFTIRRTIKYLRVKLRIKFIIITTNIASVFDLSVDLYKGKNMMKKIHLVRLCSSFDCVGFLTKHHFVMIDSGGNFVCSLIAKIEEDVQIELDWPIEVQVSNVLSITAAPSFLFDPRTRSEEVNDLSYSRQGQRDAKIKFKNEVFDIFDLINDQVVEYRSKRSKIRLYEVAPLSRKYHFLRYKANSKKAILTSLREIFPEISRITFVDLFRLAVLHDSEIEPV
jgi:hypothetical protein